MTSCECSDSRSARRRIDPTSRMVKKPRPPRMTSSGHREQDQWLVRGADQVVREEREPGIVERRHGMEDAEPGAAHQPMRASPPGPQHDRAHHLEDDRHAEDAEGEPHDFFRAECVQPFDERLSLLQRDAATERDADERREGHVAEPARLDQEQHDHLTEEREVERRVDDDEAGDADGRRGGEERVVPGDAGAGRRGPRQRQQQRADDHETGETEDQQLRRRQCAAPDRHPLGVHGGIVHAGLRTSGTQELRSSRLSGSRLRLR